MNSVLPSREWGYDGRVFGQSRKFGISIEQSRKTPPKETIQVKSTIGDCWLTSGGVCARESRSFTAGSPMRSRHPTGGYGNAGVTARRPLPCPHFHNAPGVRLGGKGLLGYYSFSRSRAFSLRNFINSAFVLTFLDWDRLTMSSIFRIRSLMLFSI